MHGIIHSERAVLPGEDCPHKRRVGCVTRRGNVHFWVGEVVIFRIT